nr:hypothetical protein [uncultured Desulfobulbus sp.]
MESLKRTSYHLFGRGQGKELGRICTLLGIMLLLVGVLGPDTVRAAKKTGQYTNEQFGFSFRYPASWIFAHSPQRDMRVRIVAPEGEPDAECAVVVKEYPAAAHARQEEIDEVFTATPTVEELQEVLGQSEDHLEVLAAAKGRLQQRPTHVATYRLRQGLDEYLYGEVSMTATPGLTWSLSCRGLGASQAQAKKNFQYWAAAIQALYASFTLPQ